MAMEASEFDRAAERLPAAESLVTVARQRLARELRSLPAEGSVAWRAALLSEAGQGSVSFGALTHGIRIVARAGRMTEAQDLFVALLQRIDGLNRRWLTAALWSAAPAERHDYAQDLAQELTMLLWEQIAQREDEAWELFFQRALSFAQRHVAAAYLRRQGLRADPRVRQAERGLAVVFSRLAEDDSELELAATPVASAAPEADAFTHAELSDLRALLPRLPARERLAVVMRFWQGASEAEIALALGGLTTRAVRYTLRRAYHHLRAWYDGADESGNTGAADAAASSGEVSDVGHA